MRLIQVRPNTGKPRKRYRAVRRMAQSLLRWTFIVIGALATASVLLSYLFHVNESVYDPTTFAIGTGGMFCLCLLYTSPSPRDRTRARMPSSA